VFGVYLSFSIGGGSYFLLIGLILFLLKYGELQFGQVLGGVSFRGSHS